MKTIYTFFLISRLSFAMRAIDSSSLSLVTFVVSNIKQISFDKVFSTFLGLSVIILDIRRIWYKIGYFDQVFSYLFCCLNIQIELLSVSQLRNMKDFFMRRLGIHSFVWTNGQTQAGLEMAIEKSAEHGYRMIEFAYLRPENFDLDRLAKKAQDLDVEIVVTMGLPADADVSNEDSAVVSKGTAMLSDAVKAVRDIGGIRLSGILYSMHGKYDTLPTRTGWMNSAESIAATAEVAKDSGVQIALEVVNRFESNLLNTTAQGLKFIDDTGREDVFLHLDSFHMNIEEADPPGAIRLAGDKVSYFHFNENYRGYLGTGTIDFPSIFSALVDIGFHDRDIVFESFSSAIVDEALSRVCGIWRDTWDDNNPLATHAKVFIEQHWAEALRRKEVNGRV